MTPLELLYQGLPAADPRRYFPDWASRPVSYSPPQEADRNSYLAGGYAEEFGYQAESSSIGRLKGGNPEDWAEWRTQSGALHPGYPECPCPLHLAPDGPPLRESMHGIRTPPGPVAFRALVVGMRQLERPDTLGSRLALRWRDFAIRRRALHPIR
jgi:hypothetical protein